MSANDGDRNRVGYEKLKRRVGRRTVPAAGTQEELTVRHAPMSLRTGELAALSKQQFWD